MRRHVNPMILRVILMAVQETWTMNIKMKKMKNTLKLHLNKMILLKQKISEGITEEDVITSLLAK